MKLVQSLAALGLIAAMALCAPAAGKEKAKIKVSSRSRGVTARQLEYLLRHQHGAVNGFVDQVEFSSKKKKDEGWLTIQAQAPKKKEGQGAAKVEVGTKEHLEELKFRITKGTKFATVLMEKGKREQNSATFAEVQKGDLVIVVAKPNLNQVAELVMILEAKGSTGEKKDLAK